MNDFIVLTVIYLKDLHIFMMNSTFIATLVTYFIMINPIGIIGPFLSLTENSDKNERRKILKLAILFSFIVLLFFVSIGNLLLSALGISIFSLQIAGGILFFKFGFDTINNKQKEVESLDDNPSFVPLGFPIIAGPGSITVSVLITKQTQSTSAELLYIIAALFVVIVFTFLILSRAQFILDKLGKRATKAITTIMGLFIISIGIQLILNGISEWLLTIPRTLN